MPVDPLIQSMLEAIEEELKRSVHLEFGQEFELYQQMLSYHLGWVGEGAGPEARGKRIRPLILVLVCASAGGDWRKSLPAGAAIELVHNFSLIHDDIQDDSALRRGRDTVWKIWGIPQAINAGDAMLTLAHLSVLRVLDQSTDQVAIHAENILQNACLLLTQGQFLDMAYEAHAGITLTAYWKMVAGKTAALLSAATEMGALIAQVNSDRQKQFQEFGHYLGMAFQAQDDILGIWGDSALTGKSSESDLIARKKSLPIVYALNQNSVFAERWDQGPFQPDEIAELTSLLEATGAKEYTQNAAAEQTQLALEALNQANPQGEAGILLGELVNQLLFRQG